MKPLPQMLPATICSGRTSASGGNGQSGGEDRIKTGFFITGPLLVFFFTSIYAGNLIISGATSNPPCFVARAFLTCSMYEMNILEVSIILIRSPAATHLVISRGTYLSLGTILSFRRQVDDLDSIMVSNIRFGDIFKMFGDKFLM